MDHRSYIEVRDSIELIVSMVKMTQGLQYKYMDHTTAIMYIDAQLEEINPHASFARGQDRSLGSTHMHHLLENRISVWRSCYSDKTSEVFEPTIYQHPPRMAGMKRHDFDSIQQIKESKASIDRSESLNKVEAYL